MSNKKRLKLFTKTWPLKNKENNEEDDRPLTATLEKPTVLDIRFIDKIDMTLMTKELLSITNLCRIPVTVSLNRVVKKVVPKEKSEKNKINNFRKENLDKQEKLKIVPTKRHLSALSSKSATSDRNNNKGCEIKRTKKLLSNTSCNKTVIKSTKLPEPCKTCGRSDQPERLHSHPVSIPKIVKKMDTAVKIPVKSTVQKPIAIKYKSKQNSNKKPDALPVKKVEEKNVPIKGTGRARSAKRTLTCYVCAREFGTASLNLHVPKCLEKWERENSQLPPNLRRKPPTKPDENLSRDEWNKVAWESSQMNLVPCENCGRTFLPDRLVVHQRSCKAPPKNVSEYMRIYP